jgi:hypothetical protein
MFRHAPIGAALHDVKDLYEQAHIANVATTYPEMVNATNASVFISDRVVEPNQAETNQMIIYVHGWRMTQFDYYSFSESMFKRLYWAGYQGRFAALKWPTLAADNTGDISQYFTYNRSEHIAFDSGVWLAVSPKRQPHLATVLWTLGFHWNQRRGVWQHPCGKFDPFAAHPHDPRAKYRTFYPADVLPA